MNNICDSIKQLYRTIQKHWCNRSVEETDYTLYSLFLYTEYYICKCISPKYSYSNMTKNT